MPLAWPPYMVTLLHTLSCDSLVNMAETAEDHRTSSENEVRLPILSFTITQFLPILLW